MAHVIVFVPGNGRVRIPEFGCQLLAGRNEISDPLLIKELLLRPGIVRINPQDVVDAGILSEVEVRDLGHEVGEAAKIHLDAKPGMQKVIDLVSGTGASPPAKPEPIILQFAQMTDDERRAYAEKEGIILRRAWDTDKIVDVLEKHEAKKRG